MHEFRCIQKHTTNYKSTVLGHCSLLKKKIIGHTVWNVSRQKFQQQRTSARKKMHTHTHNPRVRERKKNASESNNFINSHWVFYFGLRAKKIVSTTPCRAHIHRTKHHPDENAPDDDKSSKNRAEVVQRATK